MFNLINKDQLKNLLITLKDWAKTPTTVVGVQLIKIPGSKDSPPRLGVDFDLEEFNGKESQPFRLSTITPTDIFMQYYQIITNPKLKELMETIEQLRLELGDNGSEKESVK